MWLLAASLVSSMGLALESFNYDTINQSIHPLPGGGEFREGPVSTIFCLGVGFILKKFVHTYAQSPPLRDNCRCFADNLAAQFSLMGAPVKTVTLLAGLWHLWLRGPKFEVCRHQKNWLLNSRWGFFLLSDIWCMYCNYIKATYDRRMNGLLHMIRVCIRTARKICYANNANPMRQASLQKNKKKNTLIT